MKQPKDTESPALSVPPPSVRFRSEPPAQVSLKLADLEWAIPPEARSAAFASSLEITLPSREIFATCVPKITCARLAELHPRFFVADRLPDAEILLPPAPLALNYKLVEKSLGPAALPAPAKSSSAPAGSAAPSSSEPEPALSPSRFWPPKPQPAPAAKTETKPPAPAESTPKPETPAPPTAEKAPSQHTPQAPAEVTPLSEAVGSEVKRAFSFFGLFRKKPPAKPDPDPAEPASPAEPATPAADKAESKLDARAEKPKDPKPSSEPAPPSPPAGPAKSEPPPKAPAAEKISPPAKTTTVELEPVPKATADELGNQAALQKIFLTDEKLSLERVIKLCGGLSGVRSCLLAQGSVILASHQPPGNLDLVSLSANALQMLNDMRRSANKMGLGAIPAVTIHSEKGPVTFFPSGDLCLLVIQEEKGLAPGVREKLEATTAALNQAGLPRPISR